MSSDGSRYEAFQEMLKVGVTDEQVRILQRLYSTCYLEKFWLTVGKSGVAILNTKFIRGGGDIGNDSFDLSKDPLEMPYF
ncbi:hypothetical protein ACFL3M_02790 [Patescibacteria group bacterium]